MENLHTFDISKLLDIIVSYVWGLPLIILIIGGGAYFVYLTHLKTLTGFAHALKLITGRFHHKSDSAAEGQISHFKALTNALSSTVGMGNIGGVAIAIQQGGPGAIFWMWVAALVGMNTKFFECAIAVMYRGHDYRGEPQGGAMYVIEQTLHPKLKFLAYLFAGAGLLGTLSLFNTNQLASFMEVNYQVSPLSTAIITSTLVALITLGGVRRIASITSKIVPLMCVLYPLGCLGIIFSHMDQVPHVFYSIFYEAFTGKAAAGGTMGYGFLHILQTGVKRAAFSNEAGMGSAPLAHGNAHTSQPIAEGLVAMLGPFVDTIIICTMTALTILIAFPEYWDETSKGVLLTQAAFKKTYGDYGTHFLTLSIVLFSFSSILGFANYNKKCFDYLTKGWGIFKWRGTFVTLYILTIFWGALWATNDIINVLDISFAFMALPNMIVTIYLAPKIKSEMINYFKRYKI